MRTICAAMLPLAAVLAAMPAVAADRVTHVASGASFPQSFETQSIVEQRDLGSPNDSVFDYEAATGLESTTIYLFKASVANARLWFDRAIPTVEREIPMALFDVGPVEKIAAFGSASPSALRQIFVAPETGGPFKSTALVVAQFGPWIVKIRATSATLDRAGLATRIDRHLAAIRVEAPKFAAALDAPEACATALQFGEGKPVSQGIEQAAAQAIIVHARLHGAAPRFCLADAPNARFTMLGVADQPSSWAMLMGDGGKAIGSEAIDAGGTGARQLVYVSTPTDTRGAGMFDAPVSPVAAAQVAAPLLRDPAAGLFGISATVANGTAPKAD